MSSSPKEKRKVKYCNIAVVFVSICIGCLFYVLNYYTPLYADDYSYAFSWSTGERITSISQIFDSQISHYQIVNGRSITHTLAQLFLLLGDKAFNFINVIFFLILLYLIYFHACGTFSGFSLTKFSLIPMLLFLSCPAFGQSFLWITGAANYLYGILIVLCALLPYRRQLLGNTADYSIQREILASVTQFALGVMAGWTNENTSVAMIVMMIGYMIIYRIKAIKIHVWNIMGCLGGILGCILMLSSPGTASRMSKVGGSGNIISWIKRIVFYSCDIFNNLQLALLILVILFVMFIHQKRKQFTKCTQREVTEIVADCGVAIIYLVGFLASVYSMIVSPQFPGRAWSGPVVLFLISVISFSELIDFSDITINFGKKLMVAVMLMLCASTYLYAYLELRNIDAAYVKRVALIETAIASNEESVEMLNICGWSGYSCYDAGGDLVSDSSEWPNSAIAKYYGIDEVIRID